MNDIELTLSDTTRLIAELATRVAYLEDRQTITDLVAAYGPAIDAGCADAVAEIWTSDGVYDVDTGVMRGHAEISAMVRGGMHQGFVQKGCAHIVEPGRVRIDGDTAVATGKSMLVVHGDDGFSVLRATANRWELIRTEEGWKCARRVGRVLDGRPEARELLASVDEGLTEVGVEE
ncbi:nuclear transport factor 2 family protein [Gordonia sp. HY285]|nr:nuclear transport factor 2 family protein [Gordonia liuliyuniae]MCF8610433.1 nuclear transport factor 2 family protein [Gordonia liuliyuniae]